MVEFGKTADKWFGKIQADVTKKIGSFAAFLFILMAIGAWVGITLAKHYPEHAWLAILVPAVAGLFAYLNRAFATAIFAIMLIIVFFI